MTRKRIRTEDDPRVRRVKIPNGLDFDSAALWARRSGVWEPVWHVVRPFFEVEVRRLQTIVHYPRADHGDGRYRRNRNHARHATPRVAVQHTRRHRVVIMEWDYSAASLRPSNWRKRLSTPPLSIANNLHLVQPLPSRSRPFRTTAPGSCRYRRLSQPRAMAHSRMLHGF